MRDRLRPPGLLAVLLLMVVTAGCGSSPSVPVVRIVTPAAEMTVAPDAPVELRASAEHPDDARTTLSWDLGDGTTVEGEAPPPHRYTQPGTYVITLSGVDSEGNRAVPVSRVVQVGAVVADAGNQAIRFGGTGSGDVDRVKIPLRDADDQSLKSNIGAGDSTMEFWMRARAADNPAPAVECGANVAWINGHIIVDRDRFNQGRKYGLSVAGGTLVFGVGNGDRENLTICGRTRVDDDRWHHVAVTRTASTGAVTIFVDGRPDGSVATGPAGDISYPAGAVPEVACNGQPCTFSDPFLVLGAEKHDVGPEYPSYDGLMDELRLSTSVRYRDAFTPPQQRLEPDADTAVLYHFDEADGAVARDAAGGPGAPTDGVLRLGGNPVRPDRVASDAPTGA